jgi:purine nucleosidase
VRVHLDTDLGSDPDDACALVMLLGLPGVELVGVTTSTDPGGQRAGYVAHLLEMLGRPDVPVAAGAAGSLSHGRLAMPVVDDVRHWPHPVPARPGGPDAAAALLAASLGRGAAVVAVGPWTNLALLERSSPGLLRSAPVVAMGGWVSPPGPGLPEWGPERDYNVQWDTVAALAVAEACGRLTLSTLPVSLQVPLRRRDLGAVRRLGPVGDLLARQSEAHAADSGKDRLGPAHSGLPDDLVNLHYDPLACAVACGWDGVTVERMRLRAMLEGEVLRWLPDDHGQDVRVVTDADGDAFARVWSEAVVRACSRRAG